MVSSQIPQYNKCDDVVFIGLLYILFCDLFKVTPIFKSSFREKKSSERDLNVELSPSNDSVISDMGLDFTVPGTDIEMKRNGQNIPVVMQNLEEYLKVVSFFILFF